MRVAIIGAGVLGASTAFHLALAGAGVVVADQAHAGRATAAGAGIISPWSSGRVDPGWRRIAEAGARYYPTLIEQLAEAGEVETGYRRVGALSVAADHTELDQIERAVRARQAEAPEAGEVARLSPAEARALFPPLRQDLGGVHVSGGARVDGRLLAAALRRAAERRGARFHTGPAELLARDGRVTGIRLASEVIEADCVVVAAGAWAPEMLKPLGVSLAVVPQRGQITHLRLEGVDTGAWPVVLPRSSHYLLAFGGSRVVVGATRETGSGFDYRVTAAGQAEVLNEALAIAPGLGPATLVETRIGFRPVGPDLRPMLGRIAGLDGLVIGNGLGPSGLTIGPLAGRLLAQLVLGEAPELDLAAYDPLRLPGDAAGDGAEPVR
ncbi:putative oxidoreductase YurR [Siccirubricoccus deserti]|uniref:FAD-binding oxidoreductase n=1 Tax=Siccirubricoccus deserti TaxID=2013562 RepID=A0A9X0UJ17_9PROT|nr:FAD-binding oxidoreductase [Siccirubricoccus deserti]MBC4017620.1 FAD-binding oxidoreductase [Siccirubricoccus deserti]GGC60599.1 putative oxidoreductase YurR [Siccirubricoccus deserti]